MEAQPKKVICQSTLITASSLPSALPTHQPQLATWGAHCPGSCPAASGLNRPVLGCVSHVVNISLAASWDSRFEEVED